MNGRAQVTHPLDFLAIGTPGSGAVGLSDRVEGRGLLEALKLELLNPAGCQFGLGAFIDGLRHQYLTGCCCRLRPGREVHNSPDYSQVAVRAAEFPEAELPAVYSDAY